MHFWGATCRGPLFTDERRIITPAIARPFELLPPEPIFIHCSAVVRMRDVVVGTASICLRGLIAYRGASKAQCLRLWALEGLCAVPVNGHLPVTVFGPLEKRASLWLAIVFPRLLHIKCRDFLHEVRC